MFHNHAQFESGQKLGEGPSPQAYVLALAILSILLCARLAPSFGSPLIEGPDVRQQPLDLILSRHLQHQSLRAIGLYLGALHRTVVEEDEAIQAELQLFR